MGAELFRSLTSTTIATSIALVLVFLLRRPLQHVVGTRVAYWAWLLVPAMLAAALLPAPPALLLTGAVILPERVSSALTSATSGHAAAGTAFLTNLALVIWIVGAGGMFFSLFMRQRSFVSSLVS